MKLNLYLTTLHQFLFVIRISGNFKPFIRKNAHQMIRMERRDMY